MKSFVQALYYGDLIPWERGRPQNPEYTSISHKIRDIKAHLKDTMPPGEWERFEKLETLYMKSSDIESIDAFAYGLNMGILLMIEAFDFKGKQLME